MTNSRSDGTGEAGFRRKSPKFWEEARKTMPVTRNWAYLDHAAVAPLPSPSQQALVEWARQAAEQGDVVWPAWSERVESIRSTAAQLINARTDEIAFVPNTTAGLSCIAEGIPWNTGDNLVILANEFPSNVYPWWNLASRGVEVRRVPVAAAGRVDLAELEAAMNERTRLVAVSWVNYLTGWRLDLGELVERAHRRGIWVCLDAIQGLGVFPLDVRRLPIDFLAADGHKWLLGPEGAGLMYVRHEHLDRLRPWGVGWHSVRRAHDFQNLAFDLRPDAARWEGGSANMPGLHALGASLDLLTSWGAGPIASDVARRVLDWAADARERLRTRGASVSGPDDAEFARHGSGLVSFSIPGRDPRVVRKACLEAGVVVSVRGDLLRVSAHAYNNADDLDRLVDACFGAKSIGSA